MRAAGIIEAVAEASGVSVDIILGKRRYVRAARARHVAMWAVRERMGWSYPRIGRVFNRDQSTVRNGCRRVSAALEKIGPTRSLVMAL
jgi:chromosomal replication initiation ATPase DnaA